MHYHKVDAWEWFTDRGYWGTVYSNAISQRPTTPNGEQVTEVVYVPQGRVCGFDRTDELPEDLACYQCRIGNPKITYEQYLDITEGE